MPCTTPITFTPWTQRQSLTVVSHTVDDGAPTPALLHSTWHAPNCANVASASASTDAGSVTSVTMPTTSPRSSSSARARSSAVASTSATTTFMPCPRNARASASPIPDAPPVTTATLPVSVSIAPPRCARCVVQIVIGTCTGPRTVDVRTNSTAASSTPQSGNRASVSSSTIRPSRRARLAPRQKWMPYPNVT